MNPLMPPVDDPKTALITLLRSQGCCPGTSQSSANSTDNLTRQREMLLNQLQIQTNRLQQLTCSQSLQSQFEELKDVAQGLAAENAERAAHLLLLEKSYGSQHQAFSEGAGRSQAEYGDLMAEYEKLMVELEQVNSENQRLIDKVAQSSSWQFNQF